MAHTFGRRKISVYSDSELVVKALGWAMIVGAIVNKWPVLWNVVQSQSTAGLSRGAIYGETLVYANSSAYGLLAGHAMTAYGESCALLVQSILNTLECGTRCGFVFG